ncbi:MAG: peptide deformylase [Pseudomonadota bacterium]
MTIKPVVTVPDPILRETSVPVEAFDDTLQVLVDDMFETMYDAPGIGLAAVQIGLPRRLLVLDVAGEDDQPDPICMVNPVIERFGDTYRSHEEGCLSLPDVLVDIDRPASVTVRYLDRHGVARVREADGLLATAIQHEIDHLDGKLIIDFLSPLRRNMIVRRLKKAARTV